MATAGFFLLDINSEKFLAYANLPNFYPVLYRIYKDSILSVLSLTRT